MSLVGAPYAFRYVRSVQFGMVAGLASWEAALRVLVR